MKYYEIPLMPGMALAVTTDATREQVAEAFGRLLARELEAAGVQAETHPAGQSQPARRDPGIGPNVPGGGA